MRAAPALQVSVTRFEVWRTAVWLVAAVAVGVALRWMAWHGLTQGWPAAAPVFGIGSMAVSASLWLAIRLARARAFELRWDGRSWHLGRPAAPATDPVVGEIHVAVDLGGWLLLRFRSEWPPEEPRRYWLPVQRRGLEVPWHGLRCAVYSPRPAPGSDPLRGGARSDPYQAR